MRIDPHDREPAAAPLGEAADRADMRAATASEDERSHGEVADLRGDLVLQRRLLDHRRLRVRERELGGLGHRLAACPPGARDADEAGRILAAAAVALVLVVDRDGGDRPAVRAAGAQGAHTVRSHVSDRRTTCMPTRS